MSDDGGGVVESVEIVGGAEEVGDVACVPAVGLHEWVSVDESVDGAVSEFVFEDDCWRCSKSSVIRR